VLAMGVEVALQELMETRGFANVSRVRVTQFRKVEDVGSINELDSGRA
jgi:hypothetical protein